MSPSHWMTCGHCANLLTSNMALLGNDTTRLIPCWTTFFIEIISNAKSSHTSSTSLQSMKAGKWHPPEWHEGTETHAFKKNTWALYHCHWLKRDMENAKFEVVFLCWHSSSYVRSIWRMNLPSVTGFQFLYVFGLVLPTLLRAINCPASFPGFWSKTSSDLLGEPKPLTSSIWPTSMDVSEKTRN